MLTSINSTPSQIMCCTPFLQRLGLARVRPTQNAAIDVSALNSQKTPVPYPVQNTGLMPASRIASPDQGISKEWPWPSSEVEKNSNAVFSKK